MARIDLSPPAGLDDRDYKRERKRREQEGETFNRRLAEGFAVLNGEGVYDDEQEPDEDD